MAYMPENSAIKVDAQLEAAIQRANPEELKDLLRDAAVDQGLVQRDHYDPNVLIPTAPNPSPRAVARTITVNGVRHVLEAPDEAALAKVEEEFYREQFSTSNPAPQQAQTTQPRDEQGRFANPTGADPAARAEIELKFKRGEIDTETYLEQSGVFDRYLEARGISAVALQEAASRSYTQSWAEASERFKNSAAGADWPGGQENLQRIGEKIIALGLTDAADKVGALRQAYEQLKADGEIVPNARIEAERKFSERVSRANSHEEIRAAAWELLGR